jgi:hypothetical protein
VNVPHRRLVIVLGILSALCTTIGGVGLLLARNGTELVPLWLLAKTPFESFTIPGLLLLVVVGGTSVTATLLAWQRSRGSIDATILAGGALAVWIVAELAIMRELSFLQVVFGGLGLALLGLGASAAWRSPAERHRWIPAVTLAEGIGYLAPAFIGIFATRAGLSEAHRAELVVLAGLFEGAALGLGQAWAMPVRVKMTRYVLLTSLAAGVVWAAVMVLMLVGTPSIALIALVAVVGLGAIGTAQWLELRHHVARGGRWIAWTALAWVLALPLSFAPGPFVDESTPLAAHLALWACGGLLMAYVMAVVTWRGVRAIGYGASTAPAVHGSPRALPV